MINVKHILIIQFATFVILVLDVPIARQVTGFLFLSIMPGIILLRILRFRKLPVTELLLFSVGLSIAFLMFIGLLLNALFPIAGLSEPLLALPLTITINLVLLGLLAISYFTDRDFKFSSPNWVSLDRKVYISILLLLLLPVLSVLGAKMVNYNMDNSILMLLIILISILVVLTTFSKRMVPSQLYPIAVLAISVALLFHESLTTPNLYGADIHLDYYVFQLTKNNAYWESMISSTASLVTNNYNSMLSVTILPTIFSNLLNLSGVCVFKILYPLIFSLVPLGLYHMYRKQTGEKIAFLSTFFFMSFYGFYTRRLGNAKQMVGELFLVLLILLILDKRIDSFRKRLLFVFFSIALIVTHYSVSYLFLFLIFAAWVLSLLTKNKIDINRNMVILYFVVAMVWYISFSSPFESIVQIGDNILFSLYTSFFDPLSRDPGVLRSIGMGGPALSLGYEIGRWVHYVTQFFIVVGVIVMLWKRRESKYDKEFIFMSFASFVVLLMTIGLPYFAYALRIGRIYHLSLFFLAPLCIVGGESIFKTMLGAFGRVFEWVNTKRVRAMVVAVLILYFMIDVGFIYEITGDVPFSRALSMYRMDTTNYRVELYDIYTSDYEVFSARWLACVRNPSLRIYADVIAKTHVLTSYGMTPQENVTELSNSTNKIGEAYIYLRTLNTIDGKWATREPGNPIYNTSEIFHLLNTANIIYSNGESDIYKGQTAIR